MGDAIMGGALGSGTRQLAQCSRSSHEQWSFQRLAWFPV
jgi:hypothetical protein